MNGETKVIFPVDYEESGPILEDEIYSEFLSQVPPGVHVVAMMDCCHAGCSAMDLPYLCHAGDEEFHCNEHFRPLLPGALVVAGAADKKKKEKGKKGDKKKKKKDSKEKTKKSKKKKQKDPEEEESAAGTADEDEDVEEPVQEQTETKKKKKGLFGFGRKK